MRCSFTHEWHLDEQQAMELQRRLASQLAGAEPASLADVRHIAATYATFSPDGSTAYGAAVRVSYPELELVSQAHHIAPVPARYEPGLLAFSIAPALAGALEQLAGEADLLLCWGHGRAHPRRLGLATHLGMLFDRPSIGVAIRLLWGQCDEPGMQRGAREPIHIEDEVVGCALRTRDEVKPLLVSPGYRMDIESAAQIVMSCCREVRIPGPLRYARSAARILRRKALAAEAQPTPAVRKER